MNASGKSSAQSKETCLQREVSGFTIMEIVVTAAIVLILGLLAVPVLKTFKQNAHRQVAQDKMRKLGGALTNYVSQNAGFLPSEDADGQDTWASAALPESKDVWYNALPRLTGMKGVGDYASAPATFYADENLLYLPGANYPDKKKIINPQFAIAFNTKLQRNDENGQKQRTKMEQINQPARTVAFLEQGCLNEDRSLEVQSRNDYDGSPKGSAKSFVGRYGGKGFLVFLDGHGELVRARDLLTETGSFPFPQGDVIWTRKAEENPNKDASHVGSARKRK